MLVLENGDKIRGDATNAAEVDYTLYGLDNNALKQFSDGQLPNSIGDLYTADSTDVITQLILVNTGAAHNHVNIYLTPSGGSARRLLPKDIRLEPGCSLHFDGKTVNIIDTFGSSVPSGSRLIQFSDADLAAGILTVNHSLGNQYVGRPTVFDNNSKIIEPDEVDMSSSLTSFTIKLSSYQAEAGGAIAGIWRVLVLGSGASLALDAVSNLAYSSSWNGMTLQSPSLDVLYDKIQTLLNLTGSNLAIGSDADGDMYYRASSVLARLAKGAANTKAFMNAGATAPEWAAGFKVLSFTHNLAATGAESVTGVGFKPGMVILVNVQASGGALLSFAIGASDGAVTKSFTSLIEFDANDFYINAGASDTTYAYGRLTMTADGFDITWAKTGLPTGTKTIMAICFR